MGSLPSRGHRSPALVAVECWGWRGPDGNLAPVLTWSRGDYETGDTVVGVGRCWPGWRSASARHPTSTRATPGDYRGGRPESATRSSCGRSTTWPTTSCCERWRGGPHRRNPHRERYSDPPSRRSDRADPRRADQPSARPRQRPCSWSPWNGDRQPGCSGTSSARSSESSERRETPAVS